MRGGLLLAALAAAPATAEEPPRLRGILTGGEARIALLSPAGGGTVSVREGDVLGPYAVRRILKDEVLLEEGGKVVALGFASSTAAAPADTGGATFGLVVNLPAPAPD